MKITRKAVAGLLIATAVIATFFVISLNALIDKNRDRIRHEIQKSLGRDVAFDQLRLSLWGGLGLSAINLRIAEDPRFAATPFVQSQELKMEVRWIPLLFGRIVIDKSVLTAPEIQIIKNEAGLLNLSALARSRRDTEALAGKETNAAKEREAETKTSGLAFRLSGIGVRGGRIVYIDRSFKEPVEVRVGKVEMDVRGMDPSRPTSVKLTAHLFDDPIENIAVAGRVGPFQAGEDWSAQPFDVQLQVDSLLLSQLTRAVPFLRGKVADLAVGGPVNLAAKLSGTAARPKARDVVLWGAFFGALDTNTKIEGQADFSRATSWSDGEIQGSISVDPVQLAQLRKVDSLDPWLPAPLISEGPLSLSAKVAGNLAELKINAVINGERADIRYGDWLKKAGGVPAELELNLERRNDRIVFHESILKLHNLKMKFSGSFEDLPERRLTLSLQTDGVGLDGWDRLLPPLSSYSSNGKLAWSLAVKKSWGGREASLDIHGEVKIQQAALKGKKTGLGIERVTGRIAFVGNEARLENASFRFSSSPLEIQGNVPDLSQPALRYSAQAPKLKLAELTNLPAYGADELDHFTSTGVLRWAEGAPTLLANVSSADGTLRRIPYRNLRADLAWSPKSFGFKNLSFQALSGDFRADGSWKGGEPNAQRLDLAPQIESMDLRALLAGTFPNFKDRIDGQVSFTAQLRAESRDGAGLQENLGGQGDARVRAGALKDFNLVEQILSKVGGLPGVSNLLTARLSPRSRAVLKRRDTPFDTLAAAFTIEKERIRTESLVLSAPDYLINGDGWLGFDKQIRWSGVLVLSRAFTRDLMEEHRNVRYLVDRQGRLAVPFQLEGSLPNVQAKPDLRALGEALQRGLLRKGMERVSGESKTPGKKAPRTLPPKKASQPARK